MPHRSSVINTIPLSPHTNVPAKKLIGIGITLAPRALNAAG